MIPAPANSIPEFKQTLRLISSPVLHAAFRAVSTRSWMRSARYWVRSLGWLPLPGPQGPVPPNSSTAAGSSPGAVEQIYLDARGKLLVLKDGELLLSENGGNFWQPARSGFEPASDISAFTTLPGLDSAKDKNLLVGLSNGEIIKL